MLAIDHIVIYAKDPKQAAQDFEEEHQIKTVEGGKHDHWGTYNYLAYFSNNTYIEWLGVFDEKKAKESDNPLIKQLVQRLIRKEEGMFHYALRTKRMDELLNHFRSNQIPFTGPIEGNRHKPDGSLLEWRMTFPHVHSEDVHPFLIEWGKTKNIPEFEHLINKEQLQNISSQQLDLNLFHKTYQTPLGQHDIQLENGNIILSSHSEMTFSIENEKS